jgi:hypothetical protein
MVFGAGCEEVTAASPKPARMARLSASLKGIELASTAPEQSCEIVVKRKRCSHPRIVGA